MQNTLTKIKTRTLALGLVVLALAAGSALLLHAQETTPKGTGDHPFLDRIDDIKFLDRTKISVGEPPSLVIDPSLETTTYLTFECGIQVNCKTGEVKIPGGMKLDDASRKFWISLAEVYPTTRDAWVSGYLAGKKR